MWPYVLAWAIVTAGAWILVRGGTKKPSPKPPEQDYVGEHVEACVRRGMCPDCGCVQFVDKEPEGTADVIACANFGCGSVFRVSIFQEGLHVKRGSPPRPRRRVKA